MKAVVTGAAGFIGSHLCEKLLSKGFEVVGVDCFTEYYSKDIKKSNLKELNKNKNFGFVQGNLNKIDLKSILSDADYVFHLAAQAGVRSSWGRDFNIYTDNNILAVANLLESLKSSKKLKKLVFASSSSVYGDTTDLPVKETTPTKPVSPYGVTKLAGENLLFSYGANYKLPYVALRFFTVFGPRQRPDMGFNIFITKMLSGKTLPVFSSGKSTRDFTYVADIVDGCLLAAKSNVTGEIINIGGGHRINLLDVIRMLEKITGIKAKLELFKAQNGDVAHTWSDISKAKKLLGYKPKITLEYGLEKEVEWLKKGEK
ncbi:MAG: UDP-glucose 4-epimerase [Candidatus Firestonebacteria bacterium RIFOXYA2_FULL_40_8]|nr:MAG: UDP-glucose 4-epimerase [Candidatus Firestonebacteria bacterium RIFOXYA2_FULL_40_8]